MTATLSWVDGVEGAAVPVDDRGLLLADGAFETLWYGDGVFHYAEQHAQRLCRGLGLLGLEQPQSLVSTVFDEALDVLVRKAPTGCGVVRLTVTRGSGPRGYRPPVPPQPRRIVAFYASPRAPFQPVSLGWSTVLWSTQPQFGGCKLLARTEQVMAASQALQQGVDDVLMCNDAGHVISSTSANLLLRFGNDLLTPQLERVGIDGTRLAVIRGGLAERHGLKVRDVVVTPEDVRDADEVLLCNSVRGVQSVRQLDALRWEPSELARTLNEALWAEGPQPQASHRSDSSGVTT